MNTWLLELGLRQCIYPESSSTWTIEGFLLVSKSQHSSGAPVFCLPKGLSPFLCLWQKGCVTLCWHTLVPPSLSRREPWMCPICFFFFLLWTLGDDSGYFLSPIHNKILPSNAAVISVVSLLCPLTYISLVICVEFFEIYFYNFVEGVFCLHSHLYTTFIQCPKSYEIPLELEL